MQNKYEQEFTNDDPINFKGLLIYPVTVRNYFKFMTFSNILSIDKNSIPNPSIISMSYLDFLIYLMTQVDDSESYSYAFYELLKMCLKKDDFNIYYGKDENNKTFLKIDDTKIFKKDFNELKYIIMHQNIPDYKEEDINPELKKDLEEKARLENKGRHTVSIEKQITAIVIGSSLKYEDVLNLTIRKFYIMLEMIDKRLHYEIYKTASMSGMVEFKTEIEHYLSETDTLGIDDKVIDVGTLSSKFNSGH